MVWSPKKTTGYYNDSGKLISQDDWARTEGDGIIIEGIDNGRLYIWLTGGTLPQNRNEPMSLDARELYILLSKYFEHQDHDPSEDGEP